MLYAYLKFGETSHWFSECIRRKNEIFFHMRTQKPHVHNYKLNPFLYDQRNRLVWTWSRIGRCYRTGALLGFELITSP